MGFGEKLLNFISGSKNENKQEYLQESITIDLEKMKQKVLTIGSMDRELGERIISELAYWEDAIQRGEFENYNLKQEFKNYKKQFNKQLQEAERNYIFFELKKIQREAEQDFTGENICKSLEYMQKKLEFLSQKGELFSRERKIAYNVEVARAKYRLLCCEWVRKEDPIFDFEKKDTIVYSNLMQQDIMNFYENLSKIQTEYYLNGEEYSSHGIEFSLNRLIERIEMEYPEKMDFSNIFDNEQTMSTFVNIAQRLRNERSNIDQNIRNIKNQRKKENWQTDTARKEYYKNITLREMWKDIKKIDDKSFDVTASYKNILKYQIKVARAKGLLSKKNEMDNSVKSIRCSKDEVAAYMSEAKTYGITYNVLMDVDENPKANCMILIPYNDKSKLDEGDIEIMPTAESWYKKLPGKFGKSFVFLMQQDELYNTFFDLDGRAAYTSNYADDREKYNAAKEILDYFKKIKDMDRKEDMRYVKCGLEFSYQRPLIPILEALKKEEIEYYIPPIDDEFNKVEPTMKIYIDRKDAKKYKESVHSKISNQNDGIIQVFADKLTYLDLALEGTDSPYIENSKRQMVER